MILVDSCVVIDALKDDARWASWSQAAYRRRGGTRAGVLADFLVGAHAAVLQIPILTRDVARIRAYFPTVKLVSPG